MEKCHILLKANFEYVFSPSDSNCSLLSHSSYGDLLDLNMNILNILFKITSFCFKLIELRGWGEVAIRMSWNIFFEKVK